jgi:beta-N-acetylhexosaminidase
MNMMRLTDEQMAGQRLMVGFEGTEFNQDLKFLINTIKVGGLVLFSQNLSAPGQIKKLTSSIQAYAASCGQPPLFIAIDQEGGQVARLKHPFTQFPGNPLMKGEKDAQYFAKTTAAELTGVGINMNFAPVMDVALKGAQSIMAGRSFGDDPERVSSLGVTIIKHLQSNNIMAVAKHFPGIGRTTIDSHIDQPCVDFSVSDLEAFDLPPFSAAIKHDVAGIMLSHILYKNIDPDWPAGFSTLIARDMLRERMQYTGLVMTDDLDMGAVKKKYDIKTIIRQILSAEIDLVLICHKGPDIEHAFREILESKNTQEKAKASIHRILTYKKRYIWKNGS